RSPQLPIELVLGVELPEEESDAGDREESPEDGEEEVAAPGLGPWSVEEDGLRAHRFTASRRDISVKPTPTGRVRMTKPSAKMKNTRMLPVSFSTIFRMS